MKCEPDLTRELGEREVVGVVERERALRPAHDDQPEQLAGVRDRRDPQHRLLEAGEDRREPHLSPCRSRHAGVRHHGLLFGTERDRLRAAVGHRHGPFDSLRTARPDLGDLEVHRRLQRLGELQEQFVGGSAAVAKRLPNVRSTSSGAWPSP